MKKVIPKMTVITCDGCGKTCEWSDIRREAELKVKINIVDHMGTPCANGDRNFDFCDSCAIHIFGVINNELTKLRVAATPPEPSSENRVN